MSNGQTWRGRIKLLQPRSDNTIDAVMESGERINFPNQKAIDTYNTLEPWTSKLWTNIGGGISNVLAGGQEAQWAATPYEKMPKMTETGALVQLGLMGLPLAGWGMAAGGLPATSELWGLTKALPTAGQWAARIGLAPIMGVEEAMALPLKGIGAGIKAITPTAQRLITEEAGGIGKIFSTAWNKLATVDRVAIVRAEGLEDKLGSKTWKGLTQTERNLVEPYLRGIKKVPEPIISELLPQEVAEKIVQKQIVKGEQPSPELLKKVAPQAVKEIQLGRAAQNVAPEGKQAVGKLQQLLKVGKKAVTETKFLRREELSQRVGQATAILERERAAGNPNALEMSMAALSGKMPTAELAWKGVFGTDEMTQLKNIIADANLDYFSKLHAKEGLDRLLLLGETPQQAQLEVLEDIFGKDLIKTILQKTQGWGTKALYGFLDVAGIPRALQTTLDVSAWLRQGGIFFVRHPIRSTQAAGTSLKMAFSEKYYIAYHEAMAKDPLYPKIIEKLNLYIAPTGEKEATRLAAREESWMTSFFDKIGKVPILKYIAVPFKASARNYIGFLNVQRWKIAKDGYLLFERLGAKDLDYAELGEFINWGTGRGNLPKILRGGKTATILNNILYSPRYILSRLQLPSKLFGWKGRGPSPSALVRKEAWRTLVSYMGFVTSMLSLFALAGGKVELNPLSSDWGKGKLGNTRFDFWTGYAQYIRFAAQLAMSRRKITGTNRYQALNRREIIDRMIQSKLAPFPGFINDLLTGTTYTGEEMSLEQAALIKQLTERLAPMSIMDAIDAIESDGLGLGLGAWGASALGIGVTAFEPTPAPSPYRIPYQQGYKSPYKGYK